MKFTDLGLIEPILNALQEEGYEQPTPIQGQSIPLILEGRDLLGCAQTGTGKTAAFSIPTLQILQGKVTKGKPKIKALILTPTRELAIQIGESLEAYGRFLPLRHTVIFGGVTQKRQTDALAKGIDVLVATPGRLLDLMGQGFIDLSAIEFFVLDEADRMLDMGFVHDVKRVIKQLPSKRQSLFFSATMPPSIVELAGTILTNPAKVEVAPVSSTAETIQQSVFYVGKRDKRKLLVHLLANEDIDRVLVFTRTKHGANRVVKDLDKAGITAEAIHGNKSQNARQNALNNFKCKITRVLVATDIAARGIDVDELTYVINFELPNIPETYVHRIGRSGRAGADGVAYSFCDLEEKPYMRDINKLIKQQVPVVEDHPYPLDEEAERQHAKENPPQQRGGGRRQGGNRPKGGGGGQRPKAKGQGNGNSRGGNSGGAGNGRSGGGFKKKGGKPRFKRD